MTVSKPKIRPLPEEKKQYLEESAEQTLRVLERFSGDPVEFGPTALQLLDEWIERMKRRGPLSTASQARIVAFLGQTFLQAHGGAWAVEIPGGRQKLGVVCPVRGQEERTRFVDISEQVNQRLAQGIQASLALTYMAASVDLEGQL